MKESERLDLEIRLLEEYVFVSDQGERKRTFSKTIKELIDMIDERDAKIESMLRQHEKSLSAIRELNINNHET